jgi:hypothetical protein
MKKQRTMLGVGLLIGSWIIHGPACAQEYRGSAQQQAACTPDVWRLCSNEIPDVNRIVACLQQNTPRLSPGCRAVFDTGAAPARPNDRIVRQPYAVPRPPYAMRPGNPPPPYYYDDDDY